MNKKNNRKGFTTVELVIVIAVIAILATVLIPTFSGLINTANKSAALQEANSVSKSWLADPDNVKIYTTDTVLAIETEQGTFIFKNNEMSEKPATNADIEALKCDNCIFLRQPKNGTDSADDVTAGYVVINKWVDADENGKCDICGKTESAH